MLVVRQPSSRMLTLYRGESIDTSSSLMESGIDSEARLAESGLPAGDLQRIREERLYLSNSDPANFPVYSKQTVLRHIVRHKRSPFVSFSGKEEIACHYATNGKLRSKGLLIKAKIRIVEEFAWDVAPVTALFIDDGGRLWLHTPVFWPLFKSEMLVQPEITEAFRLSFRDDEYLLLGDLRHRKDFRIEEAALH